MEPVQPGKRDIGSGRYPSVEVAMQNEWFGNKQNEREEQPHADHCMHPPKRDRLESIPKVKTIDHVEARQPDDDCCGARLPHEAPLDCLKRAHSIGTEVAASNRRKDDRRCHRDTPDPDHDGQDMQGTSKSNVVHEPPDRVARVDTGRAAAPLRGEQKGAIPYRVIDRRYLR